MQVHHLQRHFARIGAELRVDVASARDWRGTYALDLETTRRGERFALTVREDLLPDLSMQAVNVRRDIRHLLLVATHRAERGAYTKEKYLCGHDERHWFVASVPDVGGVTRVEDAMEALKPSGVVQAQQFRGVRAKDWHKRHNAGFIRQGEWFFVPMPTFQVPPMHETHRHEPIRRGRGKPHVIEEVYREGGFVVYVCQQYPQGLRQAAYRALLLSSPEKARMGWYVRQADPILYARGTVRHPDHKTIVLPFWHRVFVNGEPQSSHVWYID